MVEDDPGRHCEAEGALHALCLASFPLQSEMSLCTVLHQRRGDAAVRTRRPIARAYPFDELESTDPVELRPFCFGIRNGDRMTSDRVADAKLVLLVGLGADGYFEPVARRTIYLSVEDQRISLVLMGRDLIERTDQTDASLDTDNPACEWDLIHGFLVNSRPRIVPWQVG